MRNAPSNASVQMFTARDSCRYCACLRSPRAPHRGVAALVTEPAVRPTSPRPLQQPPLRGRIHARGLRNRGGLRFGEAPRTRTRPPSPAAARACVRPQTPRRRTHARPGRGGEPVRRARLSVLLPVDRVLDPQGRVPSSCDRQALTTGEQIDQLLRALHVQGTRLQRLYRTRQRRFGRPDLLEHTCPRTPPPRAQTHRPGEVEEVHPTVANVCSVRNPQFRGLEGRRRGRQNLLVARFLATIAGHSARVFAFHEASAGAPVADDGALPRHRSSQSTGGCAPEIHCVQRATSPSVGTVPSPGRQDTMNCARVRTRVARRARHASR